MSSSWLDQLLRRTRRSQDEWTKVLSLNAIAEHCEELFHFDNSRWSITCIQELAKFLKTASHLLEKPTEKSAGLTDWVKGQVLVTLTQVLIVLEALENQPMLVADLVSLLWKIGASANQQGTERSRCMACECLREIETCYPGLLMDLVADTGILMGVDKPQSVDVSLYYCVQVETSHVQQAYCSLLVKLLESACNLAHAEQMPVEEEWSGVQTAHPLRLTVQIHGDSHPNRRKLVPQLGYHLLFTATAASAGAKTTKLPRQGNLFEVVSLLLERSSLFSPWARATILSSTVHLCRFLPLPFDMFSLHLNTFLSRRGLFLPHVGLVSLQVLCKETGKPFNTDILVQTSVAVSCSRALTEDERRVAGSWASELYPPDSPGLQLELSQSLVRFHAGFFPSVSDSMTARLDAFKALLRCFSPQVDSEFGLCSSNDGVKLLTIVRNVLSGERFQCAGHRDRFNASGGSFDSTLLAMGAALKRFPFLENCVADLLCCMLFEHFHILRRLVRFLEELDCIASPQVTDTVARRLAVALATVDAIECVGELVDVLTFCASRERIAPGPTVVACLSRFVQDTDVCKRGDWLLGQRIIRCCEVVVETHPVPILTVPRRNKFIRMLETIANFFQHPLVAQRAASLLERLRLPRLGDLERLTQCINGFSQEIPRPESLLPKVRPVMKYVASLQGILVLERASLATSALEPAEQDWAVPDAERPHFDLDAYLAKLIGERQLINLELEIFLSKPVASLLVHDTSAGHQEEGGGEWIAAVVLEFSPCDVYEPVESVFLPILQGPPRDCPDRLTKHKVTLQLCPIHPAPASLLVQARFTLPSGLMLEGELGSVEVSLEDLFLPLVEKAVFEALWEHRCVLKTVATRTVNREKAMKVVQSSFSRYVISASSLAKSDALEALRNFIPSHESETATSYRIGVFIPPAHHLLLRLTILDSTVRIRIATDTMLLLAQVDNLLSRFFLL